MSKKQGKVISQSKAARPPKGKAPVVGQVTVARITLRNQDMSNWQAAINQARNELMPRRRALYELYDNLILDAHLHAVLSKRTTNVTNKRVEWVQDGASDELLARIYEDIIDTPWFHDFLTHAMSVVAYGPTVIELVPEDGLIGRCEVVPRANVVPERGYIAEDALNPDKPLVHYRTDPVYSTYLIEVGKPKDLGALVIALPYLLWKRGGFADFAQFTELFGMPFRTGTYNPYDEGTRDKLNKALSEMGGAGYAVIPEGAKVEFHNAGGSSGSQGSVFKDLVELCNAELSKLFLGNTLTTEQGDKGARSLGEVHQSVEDDIAMSDMRRVEHLLNWELKDRLARLGYPVGDGLFRFDLSVGLPIAERIKVDVQVAQQVEVPESYWRETYGIPAPNAAEKKEKGKEGGDPPAKEKKEKTDPDDEDDRGDTARLRKELAALYKPHHHHGHGFTAAKEPGDGSEAIMEELARAIHDGRLTDGWVDPKLMQWTADELMKGVLSGFEGGEQGDAQSDDFKMALERNVMVFSGFKTHHTLMEATDELLDADGQVRSFDDFREKILAIDSTYNKRYLRAEYEHAVACGQMIERWGDIERDKDVFPFLRYSTAGDDRVRPDHAGVDGVIKPVDDAFWNTWFPPNGWGCRCDVEQVASAAGGRALPPGFRDEREGMFANNVAKTKVLFPRSHPYYQVQKSVADAIERAALAALPKRSFRPNGVPVLDGMELNITGADRDKALKVFAAVDNVHRITRAAGLTIEGWVPGVRYGAYANTYKEGLRIYVEFGDEHHLAHLCHELGHFVDSLFGARMYRMGSMDSTGPLAPVMKAINRSPMVKLMRQVADPYGKKKLLDGDGGAVELLEAELRGIAYWLAPVELFARAYNQYIAEKSGDVELYAHTFGWCERRRLYQVAPQWTTEEFAPILKAIDKAFIEQQWITKAK